MKFNRATIRAAGPAIAAAATCAVMAAVFASAGINRAAAEPATTGSITGTVRFSGPPPVRNPLVRSTDPVCAKTSKLSEEVVVTDGGLRDVHVRIAFHTAGHHTPAAEPAVIHQLECMYSPRVVGVMEGQNLAITNDDPTYHNVRGTSAKRTLWNLGQPPQAPRVLRDNLGRAGDVVSLHCDVHPWMQAYAVISDHPYFAVTDASGAFSIEHIPAGTYTLEAWHPTLGLKSKKVTIKSGGSATVQFTF